MGEDVDESNEVNLRFLDILQTSIIQLEPL